MLRFKYLMLYVFIIIDASCTLLAILLSASKPFGSLLEPNFMILVFSFLAARTFTYWMLFKAVVTRNFPLFRNLVQSSILVLFIPFTIFTLNLIINLTNGPFYFVAIPATTAFLSTAIHNVYRLEPYGY